MKWINMIFILLCFRQQRDAVKCTIIGPGPCYIGDPYDTVLGHKHTGKATIANDLLFQGYSLTIA